MATLAELARQNTDLSREDLSHLQRLVGDWGMLADFCFADLLLYVRSGPGRWLVVGHVRPVTNQTLYISDWVGAWTTDADRPIIAQAWDAGAVAEGEVQVDTLSEPTRMTAIPVRSDGRIIAILTREWSEKVGRHPGELEMKYLSIFDRFSAMIAGGLFPFPGERESSTRRPRVGDGVIVLDDEARVSYASPNAVSALHRVGINANATGLRLAELGFNDHPVRSAFDTGEPVIDEFDQTAESTFVTRCIPMVTLDGVSRHVTGAVLLLRDVSELRRRDRMIMSRDATIREIHHRVKNNLQTISSLLRLQGRRVESPEAKAAINESVRRIRTIALVHETLSREAGEAVAFNEIMRPLARLAEESLQSPDRPVRFRVQGDGGRLPAITATPLSVVLTELLQNAVDHAFGGPGAVTVGTVVVEMHNTGSELTVRVTDDGQGLPDGFELESATGLGLSIVRTLVTTELAGTIRMRRPLPEELTALGLARSDEGAGTVVELTVPVDENAI